MPLFFSYTAQQKTQPHRLITVSRPYASTRQISTHDAARLKESSFNQKQSFAEGNEGNYAALTLT